MNYDAYLLIIKSLPARLISLIRPYRAEIVLITIALLITLVSLADAHISADVLSASTNYPLSLPATNESVDPPSVTPHTPRIAIDVSGAVARPGLYEASPGPRLAEAIELAGGLSHQADTAYVSRNYNLARVLRDQEKIYIPTLWDIADGRFAEEPRILEYLNPTYQSTPLSEPFGVAAPSHPPVNSSGIAISLNTATPSELEQLPGIGPVSAQKIVDGRPYASLDEVVSKKVVNAATWEKIKSLVKL